MKPLQAKELLDIWDRSKTRAPIEKALALLDVACSDEPTEDPANFSIGERDTRLLRLREWMFGSKLSNIADCPRCGEKIEWTTNISEMYLPLQKKETTTFTLTSNVFQLEYRLPNSYDLSRALLDNSIRANPKKFLMGCVVEAKKNHNDCDVEELPDELLETLSRQMSIEDPQADIHMLLNCPVCAHSWDAQFDIVNYLWTEIDSWANHILREVALLAANFNWSEADILNMTPQRRHSYLDILQK